MNKIVLGSGPIGLICAYFEKADVVIGERIGVSKLAQFAPYYIWYTPSVLEFYKDLGLSSEVRVIKIGLLDKYFRNIPFNLTNRLNYFKQTRGNDYFVNSCMSDGKKEFLVMKVGIEELCDRLIEKLGKRIVKNEIRKEEMNKYSYRNIINTLPADIFRDIFKCENCDRKYFYIDKFFKISKMNTHLSYIKKLDKFDYCYILDKEYNRVTFINEDDENCVYEYNNKVIIDNDSKIYRTKQVIGNIKELDKNGYDWHHIKHVGRMATWNHSIRIHNVIDDYKG